jgi:hypothetical protein
MPRLVMILSAVLLSAVVSTGVYGQEIAYIRSLPAPGSQGSGEQGNAWLFHRGDQCYAVTPKHVLQNPIDGRDDGYAQLVVVHAGRTPMQAQGDRCAVFRDQDLAILRVTGIQNMIDCGHALTGIANVDALLATNARSSLVTATASGLFERSTLEIRAAAATDSDHFWVAEAADRDRLTAGMSGGLVMIQDQLAGILLAVDARTDVTTSGMARVLRTDRAALLLLRLFNGTIDSQTVAGSCVTETAPRSAINTSVAVDPRSNYASGSCGAAISAWSVPPISASFRPELLLAAHDATARWRARAAGEMTIDVNLCHTSKVVVSAVSFSTDNCVAGDNQATDVEILARSGLQGGYVSLGYAMLPMAGAVLIKTGAPRFAEELRIRFVPRGAGVRTICAGQLAVQ